MITREQVDLYIEWFDSYTENFIKEYSHYSDSINLKILHSKKVCKEIVNIAGSLNIDTEDIFLAEIIGLFHDIGRFEQFVKYGTFADSRSVNHAELGVSILKEFNVLKDLAFPEQEIVLNAVANHNRAEIIMHENERMNLFSKMIRDADKLDIWRVVTEYYNSRENNVNKTIELDLPDTGDVSPEVYNAVINKIIVDNRFVSNLNDFKLMQIGWLFDLNFDYSVKRLYKKRYIEMIFNTLPNDEKINNVKIVIQDYFKKFLLPAAV